MKDEISTEDISAMNVFNEIMLKGKGEVKIVDGEARIYFPDEQKSDPNLPTETD